MVVAVLFVVSLGVQAASAEVSYLCNGESFEDGDPRSLCVYFLMRVLIGEATPVRVGRWYKEQDCVDGSSVYGFQWADQGKTGCLYEARDALQNTQCQHRVGGQAWGDGCYMRFETYPFDRRS
ncbi:unnamed protein product [Linum trigynum]|uniref:Gnk2-homologous domain-containing protein n=1 Tax=Linum trigynum TaxID=586398 RepID=A0AAV2GCM1_9ROSI